MSISITLLTILSGICLLLWGLRTIKRAVLRGYGAQVQGALAISTKNRFYAFFTGLVATLFLQSSTATALLTASFVGRGLMTVAAGLAIVIGADIGTALMVKLLSMKMEWMGSLLVCIGVVFHLIVSEGSRKRFMARIILGLGFMLMSLSIVREGAAPLADSSVLPLILAPLEAEPALALLISALITYMMHSSLSAILLYAALASGGVLSLELSLMFMIGANIGAGLIPLIAVLKDTPQAVQIPLGGLIMRMIVGGLFFAFLEFEADYLNTLALPVETSLVLSHIAFKTVIAILFLPFVGQVAKFCGRIVPDKFNDDEGDSIRPIYLDKKALTTPSAALSCAVRETLHMADLLEKMMKSSLKSLTQNNQKAVNETIALEQAVDDIYKEIKLYVIALTRGELTDTETSQSMRIMTFASNIESCGDIIERSLMPKAAEKIDSNDHFSDAGIAEIKSIHKKVVKNLKIAQSIFLSSDPILAKQLLDYKKGLKIAESVSTANHMKRLQQGLPQSVATSGMHMDVIRDIRRINTYISSIAYHILEE